MVLSGDPPVLSASETRQSEAALICLGFLGERRTATAEAVNQIKGYFVRSCLRESLMTIG